MIEANGNHYTLNMTETARFIGLSLPTVRRLVTEAGFPVAKFGSNGVAYEFDARAIADWKKDNKARLKADQEARAEELTQLQLELLGNETIEPEKLGLSPREQADLLRAEYEATRLAQLRGELVRADEVRSCVARTLTELRQGMLALPDVMGRRFDTPREERRAWAEAIEQALRQCATRLANEETYVQAA